MQIITIQAAHLPNRSIPEKKVKADRKILHFLGKMALLKKKKSPASSGLLPSRYVRFGLKEQLRC